jgi:predicted component of type VI protein secretion system
MTTATPANSDQTSKAQVVKLVIRRGDALVRNMLLNKNRLTIGRRPYNDLELDDLTVSGEHSVIHVQENEIVIHDLHSKNGTVVNGETVQKQHLVSGDEIHVGIFTIRVLVGEQSNERAMMAQSEIGVLQSSDAQGQTTEQVLSRPINSLGIAGQHMAVIARRRNGFFITHLEGINFPSVNGESIGLAAHPLSNADRIHLGNQTYTFVLRLPR